VSRYFAPRFQTTRRVDMPIESGWATWRQRRRVANAIDALARPIRRPQQMLGPAIVRRDVACAALPYLRAAHAALCDPDVNLPADVVDAIRVFLTDGIRSPLFDDFPPEARQHAYGLSLSLVRGSTAVPRVRTR
jgi:hypothetical protein